MANRFSFNAFIDSLNKLMAEENKGTNKPGAQQKAHELEIENSILVLIAAVIRCDRNFTDPTQQHISHYLMKQFGHRPGKHRIETIQSHIETGTEPFTKIACRELKMLTTHDSRMSILRFLFDVAATDDFVNAKETRTIQRMAGYLGISDKDFKELKYTFLSKNNPYFLLGVEEDASFERVKAAYRKMVLKFHPDKKDSYITEVEASRKFREVQRAFELIKGIRSKT